MKAIDLLIGEIKITLIESFMEADQWFDAAESVRKYKPVNGGWSVDEVLEHISLTNHYLLILIDKGARKAMEHSHHVDLAAALEDYSFQRDRLDEIGIYQSFDWLRPVHMEPKGADLSEVRRLLREQLGRCLDHLNMLVNGEGILYRTMMTVNNLGKIDVYEYIYFLAKHIQRHIAQMKRNESEHQKMRKCIL